MRPWAFWVAFLGLGFLGELILLRNSVGILWFVTEPPFLLLSFLFPLATSLSLGCIWNKDFLRTTFWIDVSLIVIGALCYASAWPCSRKK